MLAEVLKWEEIEDGTWRVSECGLRLSCASEPEIESENWQEWHNWHFDMPYVYWLPLQAKVWAWFNESYRFEPSNNACTLTSGILPPEKHFSTLKQLPRSQKLSKEKEKYHASRL